jgi:hypothetical protein
MDARKRILLLVACLLISLALLAACQVKTVNVRYEVGGTAATIAVTYRNATGATEQRDVQGTWSYEFQAKQGEVIVLRAANKTTEGTVTCRVLVDGQVFKEGQSEGAWKFVDCSGIIPLPTPVPKQAP